ncbi:MAG: hypothetical protein WAS73_01115 [Defluviicoccus sp.]
MQRYPAHMIVNLLPLLALPERRLREIIILMGAQKGGDPRAEQNAQRPTERFLDVLKRQPSLSQVRISKPREGDPDDLAHWAKAMKTVPAKSLGCDVVVNVTGGKAAMQLGVLSGAYALKELHAGIAVQVSLLLPDPPRIMQIMPDVTEEPISVHALGRLNLEGYLLLHGYGWDPPAHSPETTARGRRDFTSRLFNRLRKGADSAGIRSRVVKLRQAALGEVSQIPKVYNIVQHVQRQTGSDPGMGGQNAGLSRRCQGFLEG